jgi:drug/metabolite transporter (DMT)-like permease
MADARPTAEAIRQSMGWREGAMLAALSLVWGGSFFFVGVAVSELPTLSIVTLRVGLAAAALWAVVAVFGKTVPSRRDVWMGFLGMGLLNNVLPFGLIVSGQQTIGAGLASILNATTPLFTVVIAGALLADERLRAHKIAGAAIGFGGVVAMVGPGALGGLGADGWAQIACLGGALSYACAGVFGRRFRAMRVDPVVVAAGQVTASTLILLPATLLVDRPWEMAMPSAPVVASIAGVALLSTALAYVLYFEILARAGATNLLLVTFLIPLSAILLGTQVLGETLGWEQFAGMALIALGLLAIDGRLLRMRAPAGDPRRDETAPGTPPAPDRERATDA